MKKIIFTIIVALVAGISLNSYAQLPCPTYNAPPATADACAGQDFLLEVTNATCPATVDFCIDVVYGSFPEEISWTLENTTTMTVIGSGDGAVDADGQVCFGPLDPLVDGTSYNIIINDSFGDGFNGAGALTITDYTGATIVSFDATSFTGSSTNSGFSAPVSISDATATVTTSQGGNFNITLSSCADLAQPIQFTNPSFCTTTSETVDVTITCDETGAVLSMGQVAVTVYPTIPSGAADLVTIATTADGCGYTVTNAGDCTGAEFTIVPDPTATTYNPGDSGTETFVVTYTGVAGGPDCCATGGPTTPITFTTPAVAGDAVPADSPFGGVNNSAYQTVGPAGAGGQATAGSFDVVVSGYTMPMPLSTVTGGVCDGVPTGADYWVTIYVDGVVVSDVQYPPGPTTVTITLADIAAAGVTFDENSVIEVYTYPNSFNGPNVACDGNTYNTTYIPGGGAAADGEWSADTEITAVDFTFVETQTSPADCDWDVPVAYSCVNAPVCEITVMTAGAPACSADGTTYTVAVTWTGGPDATVSLADASATVTGNDPAVDANGTATFTYTAGTAYNITVTDTESLCVFGPFAGAAPDCSAPCAADNGTLSIGN